MNKVIVQEIVRSINKDFKSSIPVDAYNLLKEIYENCIGPEISNEFEQQCMTQLEQITDEMYKSFTEEQLELFNRLDKLKNQMQSNAEEQLFIYGFCTAKLLDKIGSTTRR